MTPTKCRTIRSKPVAWTLEALAGTGGHLLDVVVIDHHRGRDQGDDLVLPTSTTDLVIVVTAPAGGCRVDQPPLIGHLAEHGSKQGVDGKIG